MKEENKLNTKEVLERASKTLRNKNSQLYLIYYCQEQPPSYYNQNNEASITSPNYKTLDLKNNYKDKKEAKSDLVDIILPQLSKECIKRNPNKPHAIYHKILTKEEYLNWKKNRGKC